MSTSLRTIGGQLVPANGQATCALVSSPAVLGLIDQTQVALNLTDYTGNMVGKFPGDGSGQRQSRLAAEFHAQHRFELTQRSNAP